MTQDDAAPEADLSIGTLRAIENGRTATRTGNVLALCRAYSARPDETDALVALAKATHGSGLWEDSNVVPNWFGLYLGLERSAREVETWSPDLVHGLVQTEEYARAIFSADPDADEAAVDSRVRVRMERQLALMERAKLTVILGAGALAVEVGAADVRRRQVEHLCGIAERENVYVGIVPWSAFPRFQQSPFSILSFDDPDDPDVTYVELLTGAVWLERAAELETYRQAYARLFASAVPVKEYNP